MADLFRITYLSTVMGDPKTLNIEELTKQCQQNNRLHGVSGILLWSGRSFFQVIEGKQRVLEGLMENIEADARHDDVLILERRPIDYFLFTEWSMKVCSVHQLDTIPRSSREEIDKVKRCISNEKGESPLTVFAELFIEHGGTAYRAP